MSKSRLTETLAVITKKLRWNPNPKSIGYNVPERRDRYLNPLLTPPPRSPSTPDDFRNPERLGHWKSLGFDYTNPTIDKYMAHEAVFIFMAGFLICTWLYAYGPDMKYKEWAKREAFLRTHKREALGLPLIDRDVIDPERMVLPTEEEIGDYDVTM